MISEGQIVLFKFPQTDQKEGKLRPALILRELPGKFILISILFSEKIQKQFCPSKVLGAFCPGKVLGVFQSGDNCNQALVF
jgi:hypothetical protein